MYSLVLESLTIVFLGGPKNTTVNLPNYIGLTRKNRCCVPSSNKCHVGIVPVKRICLATFLVIVTNSSFSSPNTHKSILSADLMNCRANSLFMSLLWTIPVMSCLAIVLNPSKLVCCVVTTAKPRRLVRGLRRLVARVGVWVRRLAQKQPLQWVHRQPRCGYLGPWFALHL